MFRTKLKMSLFLHLINLKSIHRENAPKTFIEIVMRISWMLITKMEKRKKRKKRGNQRKLTRENLIKAASNK